MATDMKANIHQIKRPLEFDEYSMVRTKTIRTIRNEKKNIEYLSNELFYEIFEYLDGLDIYQAFFNLNSYFNYLLVNSPILLTIKLNFAMIPEISHHCDNMIKSNEHRIRSLNFGSNLIAENFFTHCSIDSTFTRLESIVFNGISSDLAISILSSLQTLPRLFSLTMNFSLGYFDHINDLYQIIFSFPHLKYNQLSSWSNSIIEFMNPFRAITLNQQYSTIEYLVINHSCAIDELFIILQYVPYLRHLSCQNLIESLVDINTLQPILLPNLVYISIINPSMMLFEFEEILMKLSTMIQVLKIDIFDDITYLNSYRWEQLIIKHFPHLHKFYLTHRQSEIDLDDVSISTLINQFTSSFWIERQWFIECVMDPTSVHYSIRPNRYHKHIEIAHYFNENIQKNDTPPIELEINNMSSSESSEEFINRFETVTMNIRFTHLTINCKNISSGILIRIISFLSNLRSLKITTLPLIKENWLFDDNDEEIRFITAFQNKITNVSLEKLIDIQQIEFIFHLCPFIQYFQIDIPKHMNLNTIIRFILLKSSTCITHLRYLCLRILNANNKLVEQLKKTIETEKLLINYQIERVCDHILIKWIENIL